MLGSMSRSQVLPIARAGVVRRVGLFVLLAAVALSSGCGGTDVSTPASMPASTPAGTVTVGTVRDPLPDVSALHAVDFSSDPAGVQTSMAAPPGELRIVYFGYLSCPDICPLTMADVANAFHRLDPDDASRVAPAFVTLDPERDSGARLVEYMGHFFPERPFLAMQAEDTGALNKLAYHFEVQYSVPVHEPGAFYAIAHSGTLYVVDDRGAIVRELPFGTKAADIAAVLQVELEAQDRRS